MTNSRDAGTTDAILSRVRIYANAVAIEAVKIDDNSSFHVIERPGPALGPLASAFDREHNELGLFIVDGSLRWIPHGRTSHDNYYVIYDHFFDEKGAVIDTIHEMTLVDIEAFNAEVYGYG